MNPLLHRAQLLISQKRYEQAKEELKTQLTTDGNNLELQLLLATTLVELEEYSEAEILLKGIIAQNPVEHSAFFQLARIEFDKDNYTAAEKYIAEAITIFSGEAIYFGLYSSIKLTTKDFIAAKEYAEKGLELDPEEVFCLNMRSKALIKLNQKEEAFDTIDKALEQDPENEFTHSNLGWSHLEKGDHKKALHHFEVALKLNPNFDFAQAGMSEALKARYLVYRLFMKYSFWVSNMSGKLQFGLIFGLYVLFKLLGKLAKGNEELQVFIYPVLAIYILFALSTWIIAPISNLFLRLNTYGKYLLTKTEKMASNFTGFSLAIAIIGGIGYLVLGNTVFLGVVVFGLSMMIPFSSMLSPEKSTSKQVLIGYTLVLTLLGLSAIFKGVESGELANSLAIYYVIGVFVYQWVANLIIIKE